MLWFINLDTSHTRPSQPPTPTFVFNNNIPIKQNPTTHSGNVLDLVQNVIIENKISLFCADGADLVTINLVLSTASLLSPRSRAHPELGSDGWSENYNKSENCLIYWNLESPGRKCQVLVVQNRKRFHYLPPITVPHFLSREARRPDIIVSYFL